MRVTENTNWLSARHDLLAAEKAHKRASDDLARKRRALPRVPVTRAYRFAAEDRSYVLADLFGPHSQLLVYHFMFPPEWEAGCPSCSFWVDNLEGLRPHLAARDAQLVLTSSASTAQISAYQSRMGWTIPWLSEVDGDFGCDMGVRFTDAERTDGTIAYNFGSSGFPVNEAPGLSVFAKEGEEIFLTYQTFARGLEQFNAAYGLMDLLPKGRDEGGKGMAWLRRRDDY
ncbi:DUF899 domain-containing protein [Gymnodinialimonas hymeniacidonis]|uniref:DUF899 domain-containing protein n=1 Tax=Gymnodinialimonas hymeniacidonis TaxID=3126508 RepID=UPI0034C608D9